MLPPCLPEWDGIKDLIEFRYIIQLYVSRDTLYCLPDLYLRIYLYTKWCFPYDFSTSFTWQKSYLPRPSESICIRLFWGIFFLLSVTRVVYLISTWRFDSYFSSCYVKDLLCRLIVVPKFTPFLKHIHMFSTFIWYNFNN